jgi:hypothetical protein
MATAATSEQMIVEGFDFILCSSRVTLLASEACGNNKKIRYANKSGRRAIETSQWLRAVS